MVLIVLNLKRETVRVQKFRGEDRRVEGHWLESTDQQRG